MLLQQINLTCSLHRLLLFIEKSRNIVRSSRPKGFCKKYVHKNYKSYKIIKSYKDLQENTYAGVSFLIKLQDSDLRLY